MRRIPSWWRRRIRGSSARTRVGLLSVSRIRRISVRVHRRPTFVSLGEANSKLIGGARKEAADFARVRQV